MTSEEEYTINYTHLANGSGWWIGYKIGSGYVEYLDIGWDSKADESITTKLLNWVIVCKTN